MQPPTVLSLAAPAWICLHCDQAVSLLIEGVCPPCYDGTGTSVDQGPHPGSGAPFPAE